MTLLHIGRSTGLTFESSARLRRAMLLLTAGLGLSIGVPLALTLYVQTEFRRAQMLDAQAAGEWLTEGFLSPHARHALRDGEVSAAETQAMDADVDRISAATAVLGAVLWDLQGNAVYSSIGRITEDMFPQGDFQRALAGATSHTEVSDLNEPGRHDTVPLPYVELYAPIRAPDGRIIAVGETLMNNAMMLETRRHAARSVFVTSALASLALSGLVVLIVLQRERLLRHLAEARRLIRQNRRLRREADRARFIASQSNEELLNQLGAEIHDGPVQILSLLMLAEGQDDGAAMGRAGMDRKALIGSVMTQLRAISDGLILPEMDPESLADSIRIAIKRHETLTGHRVAEDLSGLPRTVDPDLAVCLFRFVQEGLTNAFRHAGSPTERVTGHQEGDRIVMTVSDGGPLPDHQPPVTSHRGLGLQGIRNRARVFDGKIKLTPNAAGGMDLVLQIAVVPVQRYF